MEKQYSVQFFSSFVDNLQRSCQNFVTFGQLVEVSGYLSLEIDGVKKERYVLSELVQNTGNVISESYCTKVSRNCSTGVNASGPRGTSFSPQVTPTARRTQAQPTSRGSRASYFEQNPQVNRVNQGQQVNRAVQNPQVSRIVHEQHMTRLRQGSANSTREDVHVSNQEQSPVVQYQSPVYRSKPGKVQMPNSSNRQMFNLQPRQITQVGNSTGEGSNIQHVQSSLSRNNPDSGQRGLQQRQPQRQLFSSTVSTAEQQSSGLTDRGQSGKVNATQIQERGEMEKMESEGSHKDERADVYVVGITNANVMAGGSSVCGQSDRAYKAVSSRGLETHSQRNIIQHSSQSQTGARTTTVHPVQTAQAKCHLVPSDTKCILQGDNHEPSKVTVVDPSGGTVSAQTQPPILKMESIKRRESENMSAMPSLVVERGAQKHVTFDSQCQNSTLVRISPLPENFQKEVDNYTNTEEEMLPDIDQADFEKEMDLLTDNYYTGDSQFNQSSTRIHSFKPPTDTSYSDVAQANQMSSDINICKPDPQENSGVPSPAQILPTTSTVNPVALKATSVPSTLQSPSSSQAQESKTRKPKKRKIAAEAAEEHNYASDSSTLLICKPPKRGGRKTKEKTQKKGKEKGRPKPTSKVKKADQASLTSDEDNIMDIPPASRTLRTRTVVRRRYAEDDYLSDSLSEYLIKESETTQNSEQ